MLFTAAQDAPPIARHPGGLPLNKVISGGIVVSSSGESKLNDARENPIRAVLRNCGEKTWVSCALTTWLRRSAMVPKKGLVRGETSSPSAMVYADVNVSLTPWLGT